MESPKDDIRLEKLPTELIENICEWLPRWMGARPGRLAAFSSFRLTSRTLYWKSIAAFAKLLMHAFRTISVRFTWAGLTDLLCILRTPQLCHAIETLGLYSGPLDSPSNFFDDVHKPYLHQNVKYHLDQLIHEDTAPGTYRELHLDFELSPEAFWILKEILDRLRSSPKFKTLLLGTRYEPVFRALLTSGYSKPVAMLRFDRTDTCGDLCTPDFLQLPSLPDLVRGVMIASPCSKYGRDSGAICEFLERTSFAEEVVLHGCKINQTFHAFSMVACTNWEECTNWGERFGPQDLEYFRTSEFSSFGASAFTRTRSQHFSRRTLSI
jgi:hypothetical protein